VTEAGERDLVIAGNVKTKPAKTQIAAGLSPALQNHPIFSLPDQVRDFIWPHPDLERSKNFLVTLMRNLDLVTFFTVSDYGAVEVIFVHLEQDVVVGVDAVEHPLQAPALLSMAENTNVPEVGDRLYITKSPPLWTNAPFSGFQPAGSSHLDIPLGARDKSRLLD
jgi:hypothetical protein